MKNRRRRYIIDKKLQFRLLIYNGIYFLIIIATLWSGLFLPLAMDLSNANLSISEQAAIADKVLYLHSRIGPVLLIVFFLLCIHSVAVSHRIAGPLCRFKSTFKQIMQGDFTRVISIRKDDLLVDEQSAIKDMIVTLDIRLRNIKKEHVTVGEAIQSLVKSQGSASSILSKEAIARLETCHARMKTELEYFKLSDTNVEETAKGKTTPTDALPD